MVMKKLKSPRRLIVIAAFAIIAMSVFGFAAANTVPASRAGDGNGAVAGYTVTNIHYVPDAVDPGVLDTMNFQLSNAATVVVVQFNNAGTVYDCDESDVTAPIVVTCDVAGADIGDIVDLRVVAAE